MPSVSYAIPFGSSTQPVQIERWSMIGDPEGGIAEISVIFYPDRGHFEIAYFEGRRCRIQEGFIFSLEETYKKLEDVRRKVDPDAFDKGRARFIRHRGRTREDVARLERQRSEKVLDLNSLTIVDDDSLHCGG